jgi:hypothetical protein
MGYGQGQTLFSRDALPAVPGFALAGENVTLSKSHLCAPVAQLDRAVASEATGREFESLRAHHSSICGSKILLKNHESVQVNKFCTKTPSFHRMFQRYNFFNLRPKSHA